MKKKSAGLIMYRFRGNILEVLIGHMGGPFWAKKDEGAWSILKGEFDDDENPLEAAKREFEEETGIKPDGKFLELSPIKQPSGKQVFAWAFAGNCDPSEIVSNTFKMEWPPKSGKMAEFPEIDKADWFPTKTARLKILKGQRGFIDELVSILEYASGDEES
jgi:predicted NUDIX family NTP pyrophosphohydrolase